MTTGRPSSASHQQQAAAAVSSAKPINVAQTSPKDRACRAWSSSAGNPAAPSAMPMVPRRHASETVVDDNGDPHTESRVQSVFATTRAAIGTRAQQRTIDAVSRRDV
jgi:hypothetical protein